MRRSAEIADKKLAEKIYCKVITDIAEGKWFEVCPCADSTFKEMMDKYLDEYSPKKAYKTYMRDKSLAFHLNKHFGYLKLAEITPKDIYAYKVKRKGEGAAPKTINNELALMGHAYNLAMKEWECIDSNPVTRVSKEKVNNEIIRWLALDEERRLLEASPCWLREIILFALNTGLRQGEIISLTWDRVDILNKTFTILEQKNKGKNTLPLNEKAMEILTARNKARSLKSNFIFYNKHGNKIVSSNLGRSFPSLVKKAGIEKFRFDDLRHTFATRLIQNKVDMRYAHHHTESLRSGVEVLDRLANKFITILSQPREERAAA